MELNALLPEGETFGELPEPAPLPRATPWGPWLTLLFTFVIGAATFLAQVLFALLVATIVSINNPGENPFSLDGMSGTGGSMLLLTVVFSAPVAIVTSIGFAMLRRGISAREYLGLHWPSVWQASRWLVFFFFAMMVYNVASSAIISSNVEEFKLDLAATADSIPLLLLILVFVAPAYEEFIFRGFMLPGLAQSRVGAAGAVLITSCVWALLHFQYDIGGMLQILMIGIILGAARLRTNSLYLCIGLHMFMNGIAAISVLVYVYGDPAA